MKKYSFFEVASRDAETVVEALGMVNYHGRDVRVEPVADKRKSKRFNRTKRRKEDCGPGPSKLHKFGKGGRRKPVRPGAPGKPKHSRR